VNMPPAFSQKYELNAADQHLSSHRSAARVKTAPMYRNSRSVVGEATHKRKLTSRTYPSGKLSPAEGTPCFERLSHVDQTSDAEFAMSPKLQNDGR
jgi:hypothetical protein